MQPIIYGKNYVVLNNFHIIKKKIGIISLVKCKIVKVFYNESLGWNQSWCVLFVGFKSNM